MKNLTSEMSLLSKAKERSESQLLALKREKERVEDKLSKASANRSNSKEEMRTLAVSPLCGQLGVPSAERGVTDI